jgi:hypothetical protein
MLSDTIGKNRSTKIDHNFDNNHQEVRVIIEGSAALLASQRYEWAGLLSCLRYLCFLCP